MLNIAKKYGANIAAIRLSPQLCAQLPAWYHISATNSPINSNAARCLIRKHNATTVADLLKLSARLRNPRVDDPHQESAYCRCQDCEEDRGTHCTNPHDCAKEAQKRIDSINPKLNPTLLLPPHGNLSLTRRRKAQNDLAKERNGEILFDPTITCKENLADCFRIFVNENRVSNHPARRYLPQGPDQRHDKVTVYTDGACFNNGKANARCGSGVWFGHNDIRNTALKVPGPEQSNQIGELAAVIIAVDKTHNFQPLEIMTD
ncbi:hypothetical protein BC826DRAFT_892925, partial [Russula brevipes]